MKVTKSKLEDSETSKVLASYTSEDEKIWEKLLEGSVTQPYSKGDTIIQQGKKQSPKLYNITSGKCIVQCRHKSSGRLKTLETMESGTVFGEFEFILGHPSPVSVIAESDNTTVTFIDALFINILLQHTPHIAGKLYFQLGQVLFERLKLSAEGNQ